MKRMFFALIAVVLLMTGPVMAGAGDNQVTLDKVEVSADLENVDPGENVVLHFTSNVVNMKVKNHNMECFSVKDEAGNDVAFNVLMGDDQVDRDVRRIIEIQPVDVWQEGTSYEILISKELKGKNGTAFGEDQIVSFTATGKKPGGITLEKVFIALGVFVLFGGAVFGFRKRNKS